jgi:heme oxygenase
MLKLVKNKVNEYQDNIDELIKDIKSVENKENYEKVQKLIKKQQNKAVNAIIKLKDSSEVKRILKNESILKSNIIEGKRTRA